MAGPAKKRPLAVFDIDGTVFRSSLVIELVEKLIEERIFPKSARTLYEDARLRWVERKGDYGTYINKVVDAFGTHLKGIPYGDVANAAGEVIETNKDRVYTHTRDVIKELKKKGYYLLAISHSPKLIVDGFCYELGFSKAYGTLYETGPSGAFTGKHQDFHLIGNKANIVRRVLEKEPVILEGSVGVGDTESDIPFLEMVDAPTVFNPNKKLYTHALRMGWPVVVERKDVIYHEVYEKSPSRNREERSAGWRRSS